jgi:hypothetical protein
MPWPSEQQRKGVVHEQVEASLHCTSLVKLRSSPLCDSDCRPCGRCLTAPKPASIKVRAFRGAVWRIPLSFGEVRPSGESLSSMRTIHFLDWPLSRRVDRRVHRARPSPERVNVAVVTGGVYGHPAHQRSACERDAKWEWRKAECRRPRAMEEARLLPWHRLANSPHTASATARAHHRPQQRSVVLEGRLQLLKTGDQPQARVNSESTGASTRIHAWSRAGSLLPSAVLVLQFTPLVQSS